MKKLLLALLIAWSPAIAQTTDVPPRPREELSLRDQIKAARAKDKVDAANSTKERWWDRDADGNRPWEKPVKPSGTAPNP